MATRSIRLSDGTDTLLPESAASGSGYQKCADGTLIQWGEAGSYSSGARADVEVTMPQPFVDWTYTVVAAGLAGGDTDNYETVITVRRETVQKFTAHLRNNSSNYVRQFSWMAVGRWK